MAGLTGIIITKNEEKMIRDCLVSLQFADELIVVDTGNSDDTNKIAEEFGVKIVKSHGTDYSQFRNDGLAAATGNWILYADADERVTPALREEVKSIIAKSPKFGAYALARQICF